MVVYGELLRRNHFPYTSLFVKEKIRLTTSTKDKTIGQGRFHHMTKFLVKRLMLQFYETMKCVLTLLKEK